MATLYMIRHGEKPVEGDELSSLGMDRARALPGVFGPNSQYNIGHIIAQEPKGAKKGILDQGESRPYQTIVPLAAALNLEADISVKRDDHQGAADLVNAYNGTGNILLCWEHKNLFDIQTALNVTNAFEYPGERFDLIIEIPYPYTEIASVTSENITPMDKGLPNPESLVTVPLIPVGQS